MSEWTKIGVIGVDAGLCWVGDPCYILHKEGDKRPKAIGESWLDFCDGLDANNQFPIAKQFNYDLGHAGLGFCVTSGLGDGLYDVEAQIDEVGGWGKRVKAIRVVFIGDDEEE